MNPAKFSFKARSDSFRYAFRGLWSMLKKEHNARIHSLAAIVAVISGFLLKISLLEWSLLVIVIGIVFLTELINTALETLADEVDPELNENIMKAKDYAAAAVLISAIISLIAGCIIFIPKILNIL